MNAKADETAARRAAALRANLQRRKGRARALAALAEETPDPDAAASPPDRA